MLQNFFGAFFTTVGVLPAVLTGVTPIVAKITPKNVVQHWPPAKSFEQTSGACSQREGRDSWRQVSKQ